MKLSASVLATLCALGTTGCEPIYMTPPVAPQQPTYEVGVVDPRIETIEGVEFSQPPPGHPSVAPVRVVPRPMVVPHVPRPQPQIEYNDPCPACGMG